MKIANINKAYLGADLIKRIGNQYVYMDNGEPDLPYDIYGTVIPGTTGISITYRYDGDRRNTTITIPVENGKFYFNYDKSKTLLFAKLSGQPIETIEKYGVGSVTSCQEVFSGCTSLLSVNLRGLDTSNAKNLSSMFLDCTSLTSIIGLDELDTRNVSAMTSMFQNCSIRNLDLSKWSSAGVNTATNLNWCPWRGCITLKTLNISNWELENVNTGVYPFNNCNSLTDVIMDNTSQATLNKIKNALQNTNKFPTIHRDGYKYNYSGGQWVETPDT